MNSPSLPAITVAALSAAALPAATITDGHVDVVGIGYENGALEPHSHVAFGTVDGASVVDVEFESKELITTVPFSTFQDVFNSGGRAAGSEWDPIGVNAGESFWYLPQSATRSDDLGAPFAGIGTEELVPADWTTDIAITLTGVTGPGDFALAQVVLGTPNFLMSSADGIDATDVHSQSADDHQHFHWYFTAAGDYSLDFAITGTHATDGPQQSTATYRFDVVPEPSAALLGVLGAAGLLRRRR